MYLKKTIVIALAVALSGCSVLQTREVTNEKVTVQKSAIEGGELSERIVDETSATSEDEKATSLLTPSERFERLEVMRLQEVGETDVASLSDRFSTATAVNVTSNQMPVNEFIHYVMGDVLEINYIVDTKAASDKKVVTLNLQNQVNERELFNISRSILERNGYQISLKDNVFYITTLSDSISQNMIVGIGREPQNVPQTDQQITQILSLDYGYNSKMGLVLQTMADVQIREDDKQGVLFLTGRRTEILKAIDFINLVDNPSPLSRNIGILELVFLSPQELVDQLQRVMGNEGIMVDTRANPSASIILTPIETTSQVVLFARDEKFLQRAQYWANRLDKADNSSGSRYFVFQPEFARASDLGDSLGPLIGQVSPAGNNRSEQSSAGTSANEPRRAQGGSSASAESENLKMIVDERTNSLVFFTTGEIYNKLLPLIRRLDTQPKQVMLEVIIAEVTLSDSFEKGVEFTLRGNDQVVTTEGSFGLDGIGGLTYALTGVDGDLRFKLFQDSSLVNVLSRPSVVVRDGVTASISVGTDIPTVGQTTSDPIAGERQTTQIEYRKTGIELSVTPTVNSKGVVIMTIDQSISNTTDGGVSVGGSPSIFERSINTEVVADSGQTVILGGLISENKTKSDTKVPGLGNLPIIGNLFRADTDSTEKTELVVLVTPRIVERSDQWKSLKDQFQRQFNQLDLNNNVIEN
ncbi:general secretion pathway protein D [Idiomarina aquatica]|uniref:General secretion pathway protein D n=1 Tax=Idiomarina aquatica TaxID=1327752 RepID=A0A4R6PPC9_9GAMM|nr:secretin N-terminal domain-containing protein [Idiomarina aquatica]TDP40239.1 general secretion pathway protein D [Idiomarina aquatica]